MVKNISTRVQICGRGVGCHGGHSAVEQSGYISREKMYSEYDGNTYYPKYSEDLVYTEVMLPENAPESYKDPAVLWNSVEMNEKGNNAQLARTYRVELPNEWTYELATEVMRDYVQRNFVDKGMCVQFAIHDSENKKTGQRNLHCHMLLTMRGIDENGNWMPKQKKVYLKDSNGERIPLIDKKTGLQKVDKQNRKQWKCDTIPTNDWSSRENAKMWRKDITDTINKVNESIGMTENFWEHRSFKEQGLDIIPQIHLGEKASALERAGIHTIKGDKNREIIARNAVIEAARIAYEKAKKELEEIKGVSVTIAKAIGNELLDLIREIAERNRNRMKAPVIGSKFFRLISNRAELLTKENMEKFVERTGLTSFEEMKSFKEEQTVKYNEIHDQMTDNRERISYLTRLLDTYKEYEPYKKVNDEYWKLKGFPQSIYKNQHMFDLAYYKEYRFQLKRMIREKNKDIVPKKWQKELDDLVASNEKLKMPYSEVVTNLASCEVLEHNRKELARMIENESHARKHTVTRKNELSL